MIEAAIEEFNEYGLDNASYNRIIERSGLSKGSVYYYFDNKNALLETVMEEIGRRVLDAVPDAGLPRTREEFWDKLWDYRQQEFNFFEKNPTLGQIIVMMDSGEGLAARWKSLGSPMRELLEQRIRLIRCGQEVGAVRTDLEIDVLLALVRAINKTLCASLVGRDVKAVAALPPMERKARLNRYLDASRDMMQRLLTPENVPTSCPSPQNLHDCAETLFYNLNGIYIKEERVNA